LRWDIEPLVTLQTERLLLMALTRNQLDIALHEPERLASVLHIQVNPDVFSDESRQAMSIKVSRMDHAPLDLHAWFTYFLMVLAKERRAIGVCGFKGAPGPFGSVEVGYAVHEDYRNRGYMTESVRGLVAWAFTQPGCKAVTAETLRDNFASQRVLQKVGLHLERASENMFYWKIERDEYQKEENPSTE
jgi:RimJ/RimL family protein N-acetyltransferase